MLDNVLTHSESTYTGIDIWVQDVARTSLGHHVDKVTILEGDSQVILQGMSQKFDIIYIDGDHSAQGVLFDSVLAWRLAKRYMLWDDYRSAAYQVDTGLRSFFNCIPRDKYMVIIDNYQYGVQLVNS